MVVKRLDCSDYFTPNTKEENSYDFWFVTERRFYKNRVTDEGIEIWQNFGGGAYTPLNCKNNNRRKNSCDIDRNGYYNEDGRDAQADDLA